MSERLNLVLKSKKNTHFANAIYENGKVTVLKGSKIRTDFAQYFQGIGSVKALRNDLNIVDENGILLKDCTFDSPSTAAQFVTGRSVNGYISWRPDDKMSLKEYLNK